MKATIFTIVLFLFSSLTLAPILRADPPTLTTLYPAGAQTGSTADITAAGTFKTWPVQTWTSDPSVKFDAAKKPGQFKVTVSAQAKPGICWLRLYNQDGASSLRPFLIGTLKEITEKEPNEDLAQSTSLPLHPVIVNGKLQQRGDVDVFSLDLRKGQTLVAAMEANRMIKSPMDGVLQIVSADGFVLAQNDDWHGLDPQLVFAVPDDGRYYVRTFAFPEVPDSSINFAGADTFIYRLTLTTEGFADHAFPLATPRSAPGTVEVVGWNIPPEAKKVAIKAGDEILFVPSLANSVPFRLEPHSTIVEQGDVKKPQPVQLPVTISGCISTPRETDVYEFPLKKGQKLQAALEAPSLGSPLDAVLVLTDTQGKTMTEAKAKDIDKDIDLNFTVPADGSYRIQVKDLHNRGGDRFFYLLRLTPPMPDFALKVAKDQLAAPPDKPLEIPITIERSNGFAAAIEITAIDLPDGMSAAPVIAQPGSKSVNLILTGTGKPLSGGFRIVGKVKDQPDSTRTAQATVPQFGATPHLWVTLSMTAKVAEPMKKKKK
jgi:hypothetical protein